ncbi:uncharacterized protein LOC102076635 isoform X3 [Oreochromis niloticus]|uniref:uncharacterized protein LOC102076635 isoform X3 n=1 Tax=Oreochromis niloticus TaxID=8128 RepID=UPI000DF251B9|nr:uncharacterized protein LOC102076635 isoform X3 [Oreochromis niloticus]
MKHTLVCFIFLTLQDGNTGLVKAQTLTHRAEEGGNITVKCSFYFSGSRKLFCKEKCENGNILVETSDDAAQNGRYSIKYENKGFFSSDIMYVSITQLKQSDSGWYRCSLDRTLGPDGNDDFELIVTAASTTSTPNGTLRPFSASVFLSSASKPPTTQSLSSTSGSSTPSSASSGSSGPPVESERADITQGNNIYVEIREEDRQSSSPPAGVFSTDATPKASNHMEMKTIDLHSLSASPQNKVHASPADHTTDASPPHLSKNISSDAADGTSVANR